MKLKVVYLLLLLGVLAMLLTEVDSKKCKRKSCSKKGEKRARLGRVKDQKSKNKGKVRPPVAPHWKKGPPKVDNFVMREGSELTLACNIRGRPAPKVTWMINGIVYTRKKFKRMRQRRHRLVIKGIQMIDMGYYKCLADNDLGHLNFTFYIKVLDNMPLNDIDIVDHPKNQTSHVGDTVIFVCRSHDFPTPAVHWTRRLVGSFAMEEVVQKAEGASDQEVLVLHNVSKRDSGQYMCVVSNGRVRKQLTATLKVIDESETLPFEPQCSMHVRYENMSDHSRNCHTAEPVEIRYCMGSCGRSYYIPRLIVPNDSSQMPHLNQTCNCCVGTFESLKFVNLTCPFGQIKRAFYTYLHSCQCQKCKTKHESPTSPTT